MGENQCVEWQIRFQEFKIRIIQGLPDRERGKEIIH